MMTAANTRSKPAIREVVPVNPFRCDMWSGHDRLQEYITEESCRDEIVSFQKHGQKHPVLGRRAEGSKDYDVELIFGARRLFVARTLDVPLLVELRSLSDVEAFIEMDIENRQRLQLSPYERGMCYSRWLRKGAFRSQDELARTLGISPPQLSRLLTFAELPAVIVGAFPDPSEVCESWSVKLAQMCRDERSRKRLVERARRICDQTAPLSGAAVYRSMIDCERPASKRRTSARDVVLKGSSGTSLLRISYRFNDVHLILPRDLASDNLVESMSSTILGLLEAQSEDQRQLKDHAA